jgi:hypothetical protein
MSALATAFGVTGATASGVASTNTSLLSPATTFGSPGSGAGQLQSPEGVAIQQTSGNIFVADSANVRVDQFDPTGHFISAFGWGVADGKAKSEVCTKSCQTGIAGSGPGQFSRPTSIVLRGAKVYVGDAGNNVVGIFDTDGNFDGTIDGTKTPQGHFQSLANLAVDQSGNLWTVDSGSSNVDEFNAAGAFVQQWNDSHGSPGAVAVDSAGGSVYLLSTVSNAVVERWTLTGQPQGEIDRGVFESGEGNPSALALDPSTGNLYVDHSPELPGSPGGVAVYNRSGSQVDDVPLTAATNSQGLAFHSSASGNPTGQQALYVTDASAETVTIFAPQTKPGAPLITSESTSQTGKTTATLNAGIVALGSDTTCTFQYVDSANFNASGYDNGTSEQCTPSDLGSGFGYQAASASVTGLTTGTVYHYRVVARSSAGTTTGTDQEFQAGPGLWAPLFRCPVDDPQMLASDGVNSAAGCLAANSTHGSITIGNLSATTGSINLQVGLVEDFTTGNFVVVPPAGGAVVADPVQFNTAVGPVTAVTESAGTPSNFDLFSGIATGQPIITIPIKIQLENNPLLGPNCSIGSDQNPIMLNPQNNDLSNAKSVGGFSGFDATGAPDPAGPLTGLLITGEVQGDDTFAVPGATGCGPNDSLDAAVNAVAGLPSRSGSNHLVLDDASSALVQPQNGLNFSWENGPQFANDWHTAFG